MEIESWGIKAAAALAAVRSQKPLVHNITNFVVMNETANIILAAGGLPVMAHAREEVEEMVAASNALVLNIGTLWPGQVDAMILAGKKANELGIPVVFDPVGAGATSFRTQSAQRILAEVRMAIIRANTAEMAVLCGRDSSIRGVESLSGGDAAETARAVGAKYECAAAVTGPVDVISDGTRIYKVLNGTPMMANVTGTGCMATAVCGCFASVENDFVAAAAVALAAYGMAGFVADHAGKGPGTFHANLYDAMAGLTPDALRAGARIE